LEVRSVHERHLPHRDERRAPRR